MDKGSNLYSSLSPEVSIFSHPVGLNKGRSEDFEAHTQKGCRANFPIFNWSTHQIFARVAYVTGSGSKDQNRRLIKY